MKKLLSLVLVTAMLMLAFTACERTVDPGDSDKNKLDRDYYYASIDVSGYGTIIVELDAKAAPITVANFIELVKSGFYNGLTFHRVVENFMIQGGDPDGNGRGSSENKIKGEFAENGWNNPISHERGVISMARWNNVNSASCQFFICNADATSLDGKYAAFGRVVEGMEVVDLITFATADYPNAGTAMDKTYQPVMSEVKMLDNYEK